LFLGRNFSMILLGLTGSIGMGKTTTARLFAEEGVPVFDADATVHAMYAKGGRAVGPIAAAFPDAIVEGAVDRSLLGALVLKEPAALARLEAIVHPLVASEEAAFLEKAVQSGAAVAIFDIPLLFEKNGAGRFDRIVVVTAPAETQRARVLSRPEMTEERFAAILSKQMPDAEKRARADFVIDTSCGIEDARRQVRAVLDALAEPA
jgi:dephospho-CoA kinase